MDKTIIFTKTKHLANRLAEKLTETGISAEAIHANKSQNARIRALSNFKCGQCRVLVATDIAARGLDIDDISHVVNFDVPTEPETYVHRIGRTARAGAEGSSWTLCCQDEMDMIKRIEKLTGHTIEVPKGLPCTVDFSTYKGREGPSDLERRDGARSRTGNRKVQESRSPQGKNKEQGLRFAGRGKPARPAVQSRGSEPYTPKIKKQTTNRFGNDTRVPSRQVESTQKSNLSQHKKPAYRVNDKPSSINRSPRDQVALEIKKIYSGE